MNNLTEQELKTIAMYVAKEMGKQGGNMKTSGQVLNSVRNAYMNGSFIDLFSTYDRHKVWDSILQLTKQIVGVTRIFDVEAKNVDFAKYVANELAKQVVSFRKEFLNKDKEGIKDNLIQIKEL